MFIRVNDTSLKRNLGKYQLLHMWDNILQDIPMLQFKLSSLPLFPTTGNPYLITSPLPSNQGGSTYTFPYW